MSTTQAQWIWYPGDFELWMRGVVENRRTDRDTPSIPIWPISPYNHSVTFVTGADFKTDTVLTVYAEGRAEVFIDEAHVYEPIDQIHVPQGIHNLKVQIYNQTGMPALFIDNEYIKTGSSWAANDFGADYLPVGSWNFTDKDTPPSQYRLSTKPVKPVSCETIDKGVLVDFGTETFGFLQLTLGGATGMVDIFYGESREEALAMEDADVFEHVNKTEAGTMENSLPSRAMRYVYIVAADGITVEDVYLLYEYLPVEYRGEFRSSNEKLNKIWDVAMYTLHLNTREFLMDGIKRDRWLWCGDAVQTAKMNYYSFFDEGVVRRSLVALLGRPPVRRQINIILDYTMYWFKMLWNYYEYSGDKAFIETHYKSAKALLEYILSTVDEDEVLHAQNNDWVFVDWANFEGWNNNYEKGLVCVEQLLYQDALKIMSRCAELVGKPEDAAFYSEKAVRAQAKLRELFWDDARHGYVHNIPPERKLADCQLTRHANIFGILLNTFDEDTKKEVIEHVLMNDKVPAITTPYFQFYELEALCETGHLEEVMQQILSYWGGMIDLGATTFWETYDPTETGTQHYAMYGRTFGKSLCHGWGASPIYLLGKYYLGARPTSPGYATYDLRPCLAGLDWMEGTVPMREGTLKLKMDKSSITVGADQGTGTMTIVSATLPTCAEGQIVAAGDDTYTLTLEAGKTYHIAYTAK